VASFVSVYARALTDVVIHRKLDANRVASELQSIAAVLKESAELRTVWDSPSVSAQQKLKVLDAIAARAKLLQEIRNFVAVLISNRRIQAFDEIARQALAQINSELGIADAEIVSARDLNAEEKHKLELQVKKVSGKSLRVTYAVDPKLMGGALVKVGSTVYDGSVRGQLQRIREQLATN
jgi:F-type H+-transporting ATPase subunit delta